MGQIVMAVGKSGEKANRDALAIKIGVFKSKDGSRVPDYDEAPVSDHMAGDEIVVEVDVGVSQEVLRCGPAISPIVHSN